MHCLNQQGSTSPSPLQSHHVIILEDQKGLRVIIREGSV